MKANELMIGDWVFCTYKQQNYKVAEIKTVADDELKVVVYDENIPLVFQMKYFEPIPLTAEILEKNGWYIPLLKSWWEHPDIAFWMKQYTDGTFELMIDEDSDISFCTIRYVHELQHALRLCEIDKEIVL